MCLVPVDGKLEGRFRGPHIMPGYWRSPQQTAEVFDENGFYCSGDAIKLADPAAPELGLMFDGRLAEDFKLSSGVFVSVGPMRNRAVLEGSPYVQDVVITAPDRECPGRWCFPECTSVGNWPGWMHRPRMRRYWPVRRYASGLPAGWRA